MSGVRERDWRSEVREGIEGFETAGVLELWERSATGAEE